MSTFCAHLKIWRLSTGKEQKEEQKEEEEEEEEEGDECSTVGAIVINTVCDHWG